MHKIIAAGLLALSTLLASSLGAAAEVSMPPHFSGGADPAGALGGYPLGEIDRQAAFSHHGKASRKVSLPNGLTGWVYDVDPDLDQLTFTHPTGSSEEVRVPELGTARASYTLVFDTRDLIVDVLYAEAGGANRMSALQVQRWSQNEQD